MIYKFISIKEIIEGVYRDTAINEELDIWDVIEWGGEALELRYCNNYRKRYNTFIIKLFIC